MLPIDDPRWQELRGGYRVLYDPRPALARLRGRDDGAWDELWQELLHQGDVGEASYAAVPHLVAIHAERDVPGWQTYAILSAIEACRGGGRNAALPAWLELSYTSAWHDVTALGCCDLARTDDTLIVQAILGAIAYAKRMRLIGDLLSDHTAEELRAMRDLYRDGPSD